MNLDSWLLQRGGFDDCGITSVGGAAHKLSVENEPTSDFAQKQFSGKEMAQDEVNGVEIDCKNGPHPP